MKTLLCVAVLVAAALLVSQPAPPERVGPLPNGAFLLNSGWKLQPAGRQVPLDTFPMSSALSPDGRFLLVLNAGYNHPSISVLDAKTLRETARVRGPENWDAWLGLTFTANGKQVYVGGGSQAAVHEFSFSPDGVLAYTRTFPLVAPTERKPEDFTGDVALSPDGRLIYAAMVHRDRIAVINPQSGRVIGGFKTGRRPYRLLFHPDGKSFFASSWADGSVYHHAAETGESLGVIRLGPHTTDMVWRPRPAEAGEDPYVGRLYVAAANTNRVFAVGVTEGKELKQVETINVALTPRMPAGATPSALSLSPTGDRLFIACSDLNAIAVADLTQERSRVQGFIPTGWYPTAVRALADGRLLVVNGRGLRSYPNPKGPNPTGTLTRSHEGLRSDQYVGQLQTGSLSVIDPLDEVQLNAATRTVRQNSPYRDALLDTVPITEGNPVPARPKLPSPIQHVIYILKENRTYDQVLGDLGKGNGDPSLTLFKEEVGPNHHQLAREFVLLDNFYVNADVSADGHNWSSSAIANDYVQKMWPNSYAGRRKKYDYEGGEVAALPPAGYLWTNAAAAGVSMKNYGWWVTNKPKADQDGTQVAQVRDATLAPVTNLRYRGFDLDYRDSDRAKVFIDELAQFERDNNLPQLILMRLGNDHTSGTAVGKISPLAAFADNDNALGLVVEAVSKSKFWNSTAIFVLEDDAQNGPDHVDSHRSPAYIISPYTRRGTIDSTMYNTASMLRTMELILGLAPMTHFDAGARPMAAAFMNTPDARPYSAAKPRIPLDTRNGQSGTAAQSARMNFEEADEADDDELNDILWRAIKGTNPPAPVRSIFR